jgi:cobalamin synthase
MWRIEPFVPAGVILLLLAWVILAKQRPPSHRSIAYITLCSWLLAWLSIVVWMKSQSEGAGVSRFVAQRDLGYWIGSALFLILPFAIVTVLALSARRLKMGVLPALASASALATAGAVFLPGLFAAGWVIGCVLAGYPSCM